MALIIRMDKAGNNTPVFTIPNNSVEFSRPFGATRDQDRGLWLYPAYFPVIEQVLEDFTALTHPTEFSPMALQHIEENKAIRNKYENRELPDGFEFITKPFEHQILGLAHTFYMRRAALFYAPGLGKSKIAIDWMRLLAFTGETGMTVVIGPLVTIRNWGKELDIHSGKTLRWGAVLGSPEEKRAVIAEAGTGAFDVLLVTYDTARLYVDQILNTVDYSRIVADESHRLKNGQAGRTIAAMELGQKAERKVIMTGTPTLGSPADLYGQFKFLAPYFMPESPYKYKERFFEMSAYNKHLVLGYKNLPILNRRVQKVSLRKTKEECLTLPEQLFVDVYFDLTRAQLVLYNEVIDSMGIRFVDLQSWLQDFADPTIPKSKLKSMSGVAYTVPQIAVLLNKLSQIRSGFLLTSNVDATLCDGCESLSFCVPCEIEPYTQDCSVVHVPPEPTLTTVKDNAALDTLDELLETILADPSNKALVWCRYSYPGTEIDTISKHLAAKGVGHVCVDGSTSDKIFDVVERFNADPLLRVYVAQSSTGEGITLNSANYTIFYNFDYGLQAYLQPLDRNHRIGQNRKVTVYRMMAANTLDETIVALLSKKIDIDTFLTSPDITVPLSVTRSSVKARRIE